MNLVYAWAVERIGSTEDLDKFHEELRELLPWQDASSAAAESLESQSFMALMAMGGG